MFFGGKLILVTNLHHVQIFPTRCADADYYSSQVQFESTPSMVLASFISGKTLLQACGRKTTRCVQKGRPSALPDIEHTETTISEFNRKCRLGANV